MQIDPLPDFKPDAQTLLAIWAKTSDAHTRAIINAQEAVLRCQAMLEGRE